MATNNLEIYRSETLQLTVDIDERTMFSHTILAEHKIEATFVYHEPVDLREGDYIIHKGQNFYINQPPSYVKYNNLTYVYTVNFEHEIYKLYNAIMLHLGAMDFTFFGNAQSHLQLVIDNINRVDSGWSIGLVEQTDELLITYGEQNKGTKCRNALTQICEAFNLEFSYNNKSINLVRQAGVNTGLDFEYGRGKGLYEIERLTPENYHPVTKLYIFGSKTNIPLGYRNGAQRLTTDIGFVNRPLEPDEQQREDSFIFEDIFPNRTGAVSTIDSENIFKFTDSTLNFDINENIIAGTTPMVVFKSGDLNGNEFEIQAYDHATNTFTIIENVEDNGYTIPNTVVGISVGDEYTLTGISLPQSYIDTAESLLEERGLEKINEQNRLPYSCKIDEKYIRDNGVLINAGDRVNVRDEALGINEVIRITTVSYPIVVPERIDIVISDKLLYTKIDREILDRKHEQNVIVQEINDNYELARRQVQRFNQLKELVYDPDGFFDPINFKPFSIETYMLSAGAKSQNFGLNGVAIIPNHLGNPNNMQVTAGGLVHYEVEIEGVGYIWEIPLSNFNGLDPLKSYYLYARCSKIQLVGTWMLSETPVLTDDPNYPGFWNFNVGILYDVKEGRRDFDFTKGMTYIVGDTITTGRIKSLDGLSFFDLTANKFKLGTATKGIDWDVTNPGNLTILGGIIQNAGGASAHIPLDRGPWQSGVVYYPGDEVTYDGSTYRYSGSVPGNTAPPPSASIWVVSAAKGQAGADGTDGAPANYTELRYQETGSPTLPPTVPTTNPNPPLWTTSMPNYDPVKFIWMISAVKSGVNGSLITNWQSVPVRVTGVTGSDGSDGKRGPGIVFRGVYDNSETYYGNDDRIDIVYYLGLYYQARADMPGGQSTGVLPTDLNYWNEFGAQFDSVATGLLLAEYAVITNLGAQYIQTAIPGNKRIEINERREKKNASGAGIGVWVDQNNIALFNSANQKLLELDDDSSPSNNIFYLEFSSTNSPSLNDFRGNRREWNWSQYNAGSFDSRTGTTGNFTNGFPPFVFDLITYNISGTRTRFYFRYAAHGYNASDPNTDSALTPNTSVGEDWSSIKNLGVHGSLATGRTRISSTSGLVLDSEAGLFGLDYEIWYTAGTGSFLLPRFNITSGSNTIMNEEAMKNIAIGREVRITNKGTGMLTISPQGSGTANMFVISGTTEVASVDIPTGYTYTFKVVNIGSSPTNISSWRWAVVEVSEPKLKTRRIITASATLTPFESVISFPNTGTFTITLPANPYDGQRHEFVRAHSSSVTLTFNGNGKSIVYSGTVYTGATSNVSGYHGTAIFIAEENRWYLSSYT